MKKDPIQQVEKIAKEIHSETERKARPLVRRYPLTFALITGFGAAMAFEGFQIGIREIALFREHPFVLMCVGLGILFTTGTLYKKLLSH